MNYELKLKTGEKYWISQTEYNDLFDLNAKEKFFYIHRLSKSINVDVIHSFGIPDSMVGDIAKDAIEFKDGEQGLFAKIINNKGREEWRKFEDKRWKRVTSVVEKEQIDNMKKIEDIILSSDVN